MGMSGYFCVCMCAHICTLHPILRSIAGQQGCSVNKCIVQDTSAEKQVQAICNSFPDGFISFSLDLRFLFTFSRKHSQLMGCKARLPSLPANTQLKRLSGSSCSSRSLASLWPSFLHTDVFTQGNTFFPFPFFFLS